jgi:outer membrane protein
MMKFKLVMICFLGAGLSLSAQTKMLPEEAVQLALKQNLQIKIQKNIEAQIGLNKTWGNAGFLPDVQINSGYTLQSIDLKQEFSNGLKVDRRGVGSNNIQAGLGLQWVMFDGGRMFSNWYRLQEEARIAGLTFRQEAEQVVSSTLLTYFEIVKLQQQLKAIKAGLDMADQQVLVSRTRMESGAGNRQELLQSEIDRNTWKSLLIEHQNMVWNAKVNLNMLLNREADLPFEVLDSLPDLYQTKELQKDPGMIEQNADILIATGNQYLAKQALKIQKSNLFPSILFNAGYNYGRTSSEGGFALFNQSIGPIAGIGLSWNVFNGGRTRTAISQARLFEENTKLIYRSVMLSVKASERIALRQLNDFKSIRDLEKMNLEASRENMELALERYRFGKADLISFRESQRSFQESISRLSAVQLSVLKAEIELLKIRGSLIR